MLKFLLASVWTAATISVQAATLIDYGAPWQYFVGTSEASSPDVGAWRQAAFNDTSWASGPAPIGYANPANSESESALATFIPSSQEAHYLSVFFRKSFVVNHPSAVRQLNLNFNVDDGYIAWINGVEVARYNVPSGDLFYTNQASSAIEPTLSSAAVTENLQKILTAGTNVLAVQVFNGNLTSSDLLFDASLSVDLDETAPRVVESIPKPATLVRELTSLEVIFDENVTGVDAADLLINGTPATELTAVSPRDYVFGFAQPGEGDVTVSWAAGHGITDLAAPPNPFSGGLWILTLDLSPLPPSIVISEFMADNQHGIKDDDGNRSDWIELFNYGLEAINLDGWFLSDTTNNPAKWRLPALWLDAGKYLLVWASGKDRANATAPLHTNFKLGKGGGYLALLDPNTNLVSAFTPAYPPQPEDVSYGRDVLDPSAVGYFNTPTPAARNSTSGQGFAPAPVFSSEGGVFTNASITISLSAPSGQVRYTLDGSVPGTNSPIYSVPLSVVNTTTIKARVFQAGLFPGPVVAQTYLMLDGTVAKFTSNLPLMIISTSGRGIVDHPPPGNRGTFASILAVDTFRGRSSPLGAPDYFGQCGISIRGQTSSGFPKRPYRVELQDAWLNDRNAQLFGLPSEADWVLNNPYTDKPFLQNYLAFELFEQMGHYSVRRRFVEVFVNTANGKISYPRDYVGIYILLEKIKVDKDRVDIAKLTPYDTTEPEISGGYMFKKDKDTVGDLNFSTQGGAGFAAQNLKIHEPAPREITSAQLNWIRTYLRQMELALYATDWKTRTGTNHYSSFLDVDSFVDQHWIVEFAKQIDGYRLSNYMQKDRNGKVKMEPVWDWNLSFGNADYLDGYNTVGWYWSLLGATDHIWLRRLICGTTSSGGTTGDPDFNQKITDRWSTLRTNVLNGPRVLARVDELAAYLSEAAPRDYAKWPRLGTYIWPNPSFYVTPTTFSGIIAAMKNWIQGRYNWIDSQFVRTPVLTHGGGRVPNGFSLGISAPAGTVYYTLNGIDPRMPGGAVSPSAVVYRGPISLNSNARVFARAMSGSRWSGPTAATFIVNTPPLILTEIMYHPTPGPAGGPYADGDFEFLEFKNTGGNTIDLEGFQLAGGVQFTFPRFMLQAAQRVLVVKNKAAFESRYGSNLPVAGEYQGSLDNDGDHLVLFGRLHEPVLDFNYKDSWYRITDGPGFSLVLADESALPDMLGEYSTWRPSATMNGSPGMIDPSPALLPHVVISEVLSNPLGLQPDLVELQNLSPVPVDVSGWFLTDDDQTPMKYRIPAETIISPGELLVISGSDFTNSANTNVIQPFGLSSLGDQVYVFSGATNSLTGYLHGFSFGAQAAGVSFGRHVDSFGTEHFVSQASPTFGSTNSGPRISTVVISELMYHPPDVFTNSAYWNNTEDEYLELYNRTVAPVSLYDPQYPTNTWRLSGDVEFAFPTNFVVAPNSYVLIVNFDPVAQPAQLTNFRSKYSVPSQTMILGPYSGNLDNAGGRVSLSYPEPPIPAGSNLGTVPYVLADAVEYSQDWPWPPAADGLGFSLERLDAVMFGNDPANWRAVRPAPGRAAAAASPITILQQPATQIGLVGQTISLGVLASGTGNLRYQWRFNGQNLPGATNVNLLLPGVQTGASGQYVAVVYNSDASIATEPANLIVETDSDADLIPDSWEFAYELNPFDANDAPNDPDGDSVSNRGEYISGTDPRDSASYVRIGDVSVSNETTISFHAAAFRSYTVQYTESLNPVAWIKLADIPAKPAASTATVSDPTKAGTRYYRLVAPAQPD